MVVSTTIVNTISDTQTIGRSVITFINGVLCVVLTVMSGTSSVSTAEDAVLLRNLSIAFGATVSILNLFLYLVIDIMISACTNNITDKQSLEKLFDADPTTNPDQSIVQGTQMMLSILNQMKVAGNNLGPNNVNDKATFQTQLKNLESSLNNFGTMA